MSESPHELRYTDLDLLKQIAAQGMLSAPEIEKRLGRFVAQHPEFANDTDLKHALRHADVIKAQVMHVSGKRFAKEPDFDHYSDGRPVVVKVPVGDSNLVHKHVWYADPDHPHNHPAPDQPAVATIPDPIGRIFKLFVTAPHEIGVIELGDEERDRL